MGDEDEIVALATELNTLQVFRENTMATMRALFADDDAGFRRCIAVLSGAMVDNGATIDLQYALDQCIEERDRARAAVKRLEDGGDYYAAAIVSGRA